MFAVSNEMSLSQVVCVSLLLTFQAPACSRGDPILDMLGTIKDKIFAVESSLETDIKLLRMDMNRLSNKFDDLPTLFKDGLVDNAGETPERDKTSNYTRKYYDQFTLRMKRAFTEEKVQIRRIMGELKSEIAGFGERQVQGLTHLRQLSKQFENFKKETAELKQSQTTIQTGLIDFINESSEEKVQTRRIMGELKSEIAEFGERQVQGLTQFDNFKKEIVSELKQGQTMIQTGLTDFIDESFVQAFGSQIQTSVDTMINTVTSVTKQCVSGLESPALVNEQQKSFVNKSMTAISLHISNIMERLGDDVAYIKDKVRFDNRVYTAFPARLVNISLTSNTVGGRLEVHYDGEWGTVCDDDFGTSDAAVACRMLGFSGAHAYKPVAYFGHGVGKTWMDDLACTGEETTLFDCSRIGAGSPGSENCRHEEDVGVICDFNFLTVQEKVALCEKNQLDPTFMGLILEELLIGLLGRT